MKKPAGMIYAQSSDIKSRTFLEYRKDIKKKATAELEVKDWIAQKLRRLLHKENLGVEKYGGDKFLWFLRKGVITRQPDFVARTNGEEFYVEFQYSDREDLDFFDFKISKVVKKVKGKLQPHSDRLFLYVLKPSSRYAFIKPEWIVENAQRGPVPAWGSSEAYRVPGEKLLAMASCDEALKRILRAIDIKHWILEFQHSLIQIWTEKLSKLLRSLIDEEKLVKFVPRTLDGFFKGCFMLDHIDKIPKNANLWVICLLSFVSDEIRLGELAKLVYCLDFLYSKIEALGQNEVRSLTCGVKRLLATIDGYAERDGTYRSTLGEAPVEETRYALFSINLLDDTIQDLIYYYKADLPPVRKIYGYVKDIERTYQIIRDHC